MSSATSRTRLKRHGASAVALPRIEAMYGKSSKDSAMSNFTRTRGVSTFPNPPCRPIFSCVRSDARSLPADLPPVPGIARLGRCARPSFGTGAMSRGQRCCSKLRNRSACPLPILRMPSVPAQRMPLWAVIWRSLAPNRSRQAQRFCSTKAGSASQEMSAIGLSRPISANCLSGHPGNCHGVEFVHPACGGLAETIILNCRAVPAEASPLDLCQRSDATPEQKMKHWRSTVMSVATVMVYVEPAQQAEEQVSVARAIAAKFDASVIGVSAFAIEPDFVAEGVIIQETTTEDIRRMKAELAEKERWFREVVGLPAERVEWRWDVEYPLGFLA